YTLTKTLDFATDVQEVNDNLDIQIFPNPSHEDLIVSLNKEWMNARITLIYPDGKSTGLLSSVPGTGKIIISRNTRNLKSGIYFLKIESASGSFTKKIVFL
ncbi:MAG: T9SS type A sorting domain-containing protein, partial [Chitinophagales bacterium]